MGSLSVIALGLVVLCAVQVFGQQQQQQFGQGDISSQLGNAGYVQKQINCVLDKGPCDRTGKQLKMAIPEVIQRNCRSCSQQQATNARRLISFVQKKYPAAWQEINAKYRG